MKFFTTNTSSAYNNRIYLHEQGMHVDDAAVKMRGFSIWGGHDKRCTSPDGELYYGYEMRPEEFGHALSFLGEKGFSQIPEGETTGFTWNS